jgi:hypothetical protein
MHSAYWIPKTKDTNSEYVILIALPLQQWLHERVSMLRYTYTAFLMLFICVWFIQQRRNYVTSNGLIRLNWKVCGRDWYRLTLGDIPALAGRYEENQKPLPHDSRSKGHNLNRGPPEHEAAVLGTRTRRPVSVNRRKYSRVQLKRDGTRWRTGRKVKVETGEWSG